MVYCGKPSRGCQMCRTRRIKCDESKPTCSQCVKSRRVCPGYKDEFDLVFRNETLATERRARRANRKALLHRQQSRQIAPPPPPQLLAHSAAFMRETSADDHCVEDRCSSFSSSSPFSTDPVLYRTDAAALIRGPDTPLHDRASCHFVANFVLIPRQDGCSGFLDFVPALLRTGADTTSHPLAKAFTACALAALGNRAHSGAVDLAARAIADYNAALFAVHDALRDPIAARSDATLASVLLLGLFENITAKNLGTLAWGTHISGAVHLTKLRGRKQLRTKIGLQLFIAVRTQMIIHSISTGQAPIMGVEWWLNDAVKNQTASEVMRLNIRTSELRAEVTRLMAECVRAPASVDLIVDMIRRAYLIDGDCWAWMRAVPTRWRPRTVAWQEDHLPAAAAAADYSHLDVFPGRVDVYTDIWTASVWNMARCARLVLASIIVRCAAWACSPIDYRTTPEYATACRTCVDTIADIIASVPNNLGWRFPSSASTCASSFASPSSSSSIAACPSVAATTVTTGITYTSATSATTSPDESAAFACGQEDVQKMLAGYFLIWPLALVYGQDYTTDAQRQWVYGRLEHIADGLGIKSAHIFAQVNVRLPSMLIRRDGLLAQPYPQAQDFEKLVSARLHTPAAALLPLAPLPLHNDAAASSHPILASPSMLSV